VSAKREATYHGADVVARLRASAPYSDDGPAMREAADEIERLRAVVAKAWDEGRESFARDLLTPLTANGMRKSSSNPFGRPSDA
jgi:hypothetical protein